MPVPQGLNRFLALKFLLLSRQSFSLISFAGSKVVMLSNGNMRVQCWRRIADRPAQALMACTALVLSLTVAGCQTDQQVADVKPMTKCEAVAKLLSSPSATHGQTAMAMEVGRNSGCFGQSPPQTVLLR